MTTIDPRAAAIEAAASEILTVTPGGDMRGASLAAERAVAAAVPHLTAGLRAKLNALPLPDDYGEDVPIVFAGTGKGLYRSEYVNALEGFAADVEQALDAIESEVTRARRR